MDLPARAQPAMPAGDTVERGTRFMLRYVNFERHLTRDRLAINPATVTSVEAALPSSAHSAGAARILTMTGKEYVVEGSLEETLTKLTGTLPHEKASADHAIRVTRSLAMVGE
jgi:hypothetical protein